MSCVSRNTLPKDHDMRTVIQLGIFGNSLTVLASSGTPIALGPISCGECGGKLSFLSDESGTTYCRGCFESECGSCYNVCGPERDYSECENCETCSECCECFYCEQGSHMVTDLCETVSGDCDDWHCARHCDCVLCPNCNAAQFSGYCESCSYCECEECQNDGAADDVESYDIVTPFSYAPMGAVLSTDGRAFGVELEVTTMTQTTALRALRRAGLAAETYGGTDVWAIVDDCSINGTGCEVRSPILRGADGFLQLRVAMAALEANGATVDESCGTHVHHDMTGSNGKQLAAVARHYKANQAHVDTFALRGSNESYAKAIDDDDILIVENAEHTLSSACCSTQRYRAVNFQAFAAHDTLEFRQHAGTLDYAQIKAWILFGQALITSALSGATATAADTAETLLANLKRWGMTEDAETQLVTTSRRTRALLVGVRY